jgi:hypothetical protein
MPYVQINLSMIGHVCFNIYLNKTIHKICKQFNIIDLRN